MDKESAEHKDEVSQACKGCVRTMGGRTMKLPQILCVDLDDTYIETIMLDT